MQGHAFILKQLFHLIRGKQDPRSTTHNKDDAHTDHFLSERSDTAYRIECVNLNALNRHTRSCRFVVHEL